MDEFISDVLSGATSDALLKVSGLVFILLAGLALRFGWVRRIRIWCVRTVNYPRVEAISHYGASLDNWSPIGSTDAPPPPRDLSRRWALENGGGPLTVTGSLTRTIALTVKKPASFEILRVWVTYSRKELPTGTAFFNVSDGFGAGFREPARFIAILGYQGGTNHRVPAKRVVSFDAPEKESAGAYRLTEATDLQIDLHLTLLTEGIYTYSIEVDVAVNGIRRVFTVDKAMLDDQEFPLTTVFARNPEMVHEEFTEYPETKWLPGPRQ